MILYIYKIENKNTIKEGIYMLKDLCFEVIQTCPNKCKFCSSNSSKDKKTIITLEDFKKTVIFYYSWWNWRNINFGWRTFFTSRFI